MSARHGKIARLPFEIREELNTRLLNGETAVSLVPWLNAQPAVQSILTDQFRGSLISEQNVSNWRQGGFCDWVGLRDWRAICATNVEDSAQIAATGFNAGNFLLLLTARLAANLDRWEATPDSGPLPQMAALHRLVATVLRIHQSELKDARLALDREQIELQREKQRNAVATELPPPVQSADSPSAPKPEPIPEPAQKPAPVTPPTRSASPSPSPALPVASQPVPHPWFSPIPPLSTPLPPFHSRRSFGPAALAA